MSTHHCQAQVVWLVLMIFVVFAVGFTGFTWSFSHCGRNVGSLLHAWDQTTLQTASEESAPQIRNMLLQQGKLMRQIFKKWCTLCIVIRPLYNWVAKVMSTNDHKSSFPTRWHTSSFVCSCSCQSVRGCNLLAIPLLSRFTYPALFSISQNKINEKKSYWNDHIFAETNANFVGLETTTLKNTIQ